MKDKVGRSAVTQSVSVRMLFMDITDAPIRKLKQTFVMQEYYNVNIQFFLYTRKILV